MKEAVIVLLIFLGLLGKVFLDYKRSVEAYDEARTVACKQILDARRKAFSVDLVCKKEWLPRGSIDLEEGQNTARGKCKNYWIKIGKERFSMADCYAVSGETGEQLCSDACRPEAWIPLGPPKSVFDTRYQTEEFKEFFKALSKKKKAVFKFKDYKTFPPRREVEDFFIEE